MHKFVKRALLLGLGLFASVSAMLITDVKAYAFTAADGSEWMVSKASHLGFYDVEYSYYEGTSICKELKYTMDEDVYTITYDQKGNRTSYHRERSGDIQEFVDGNGYYIKKISKTEEEEFFYEEVDHVMIPEYSIVKKSNGTTIMYNYLPTSEAGTYNCVAVEIKPDNSMVPCASDRPAVLPISFFQINARENIEIENLLKLADLNDVICVNPNALFVMEDAKQTYDIQWADQNAKKIKKIDFQKLVMPSGIMQYYVEDFRYRQSGCLESFIVVAYQKDTDPKSSDYGVELKTPMKCSYVWVCVKDAPPKVEVPKDDNKTDEKKDDEKKDEKPESNMPLKKGETYSDKTANVKIMVTLSDGKINEAELIGMARKGASQLVIPDTVQIGDFTYQVTSIKANAFKNNTSLKKVVIGKKVKKIGKNAFYGCKNLKSVQIKTVKLTTKTVGKNAFAKIHKKAKVKVPAKKLKAYKKILKSRGINKKSQKITK